MHDDPLVFDGNVAAVDKIGDDTADHFARGADACGDLLLGEAFGASKTGKRCINTLKPSVSAQDSAPFR